MLILDNLRSAENVGAIFRTADAAGVSKIFLTGYTPAPRDRFDRPVAKIAKAALGAEDFVAWETRPDALGLIKELRGQGYRIVALEQAPNSVDYSTISADQPLGVIVGNEVEGVSPELLAASDLVAEIPMGGRKESLNVSVAVGIFLFRLLDA